MEIKLITDSRQLKQLFGYVSGLDQAIHITLDKDKVTAIAVSLGNDKIKKIEYVSKSIIKETEALSSVPFVINFMQVERIKKIINQFNGEIEMTLNYTEAPDKKCHYVISVIFSDPVLKLSQKTVDWSYYTSMNIPSTETVEMLAEEKTCISGNIPNEAIQRLKVLAAINPTDLMSSLFLECVEGYIRAFEYSDIEQYNKNKERMYQFILCEAIQKEKCCIEIDKEVLKHLSSLSDSILFEIHGDISSPSHCVFKSADAEGNVKSLFIISIKIN